MPDFGKLKVVGFSSPVSEDFFKEAVISSQKHGQTQLLPGQYETSHNKATSLARLNLSRSLHTLERECQEKSPAINSEEVSNESYSSVETSLPSFLPINPNLLPSSRDFKIIDITEGGSGDKELICEAPLDFTGWSRKTIKLKNLRVNLVHTHKDTKKKHIFKTFPINKDIENIRVTYCHHLKVAYFIYLPDDFNPNGGI